MRLSNEWQSFHFWVKNPIYYNPGKHYFYYFYYKMAWKCTRMWIGTHLKCIISRIFTQEVQTLSKQCKSLNNRLQNSNHYLTKHHMKTSKSLFDSTRLTHSEMLAHIMRTSFVWWRWTKCPQFKVHLFCIRVTVTWLELIAGVIRPEDRPLITLPALIRPSEITALRNPPSAGTRSIYNTNQPTWEQSQSLSVCMGKSKWMEFDWDDSR